MDNYELQQSTGERWNKLHHKVDYMTEFKLIAYEKENGEVPVEEFLDSVNSKMRAKIFWLLGILQEMENMLREPYSKYPDDGIFELRCKFGSDITRVLYFFYYEGKIILTNGVVKKTQKTPKEEIKIAKDRRKDFIERVMKDENIWWYAFSFYLKIPYSKNFPVL